MSGTGQIELVDRLYRRVRAPWSLAVRLAMGFAAGIFLLLVVTAAFPYYALAYNLNREDNESIVEKVTAIAEIASRHSSDLVSADGMEELRRAVAVETSEPIYARVLRRPGGEVVVESEGMGELVPVDRFAAPVPYPFDRSNKPAMEDEKVKKHRAMRMLAAALPGKAGETGASGGLVVQVALDRTPESELLETYGNCLLGLFAVGLLVAAVAGYAIAWRGLRPLRRMAGAVARIGSSNLHERLEVRDAPPELASLATAFNSMLSRLQESFARLSQFSSDIAHELRTPANNVRGLVELTLSQKDRSPEQRAEQLTNALAECERLTKLIESLLFLARAENPQTQIQRQEIDLRQELNGIYEFYEASAAEAGVKLEVAGEANVKVSASRLLVQRAVANLVENAIAHTPSGGTVTMSTAAENGGAVVRVSDTGAGIPAEHLPRVFDRFYRADESRSKHTGGVGLGLAIVRSIAVMHGGTATARNREGGGAEFTLTIPGSEKLEEPQMNADARR